MMESLKAEMKALWEEKRPALRRAAVRTQLGLRALWQTLRPPLVFMLQVVAALILLFEEWGWEPLVRGLERLARFRLWARLEAAIAALPPYGALAVFVVPSGILFPVKLLALYFMAKGAIVAATAVFIAAKVVSTALVARIFLLTKPALMQIGWFAYGYGVLMPWKDRMFAMIRESWVWRYGRVMKTIAKRELKKAIDLWRPRIAAWFSSLRARWAGVKPRLVDMMIAARVRVLAFVATLRRG